MEKTDIIKAFQTLADKYSKAIEFAKTEQRINNYMAYLEKHSLDDGMCWAIYQLNNDKTLSRIMCGEIEKDVVGGYSAFSVITWYTDPSCGERKVPAVVKNSLQPRLDHLNRTIARLEKELQTTT
jgi:hypothetical protein